MSPRIRRRRGPSPPDRRSPIPGWREAVDRGARSLAPGGELHIVDFGRCEGLPRTFSLGLNARLARFSVEQRIAARLGLEVRLAPLDRGYATLAIRRAAEAQASRQMWIG